MSTADKIAHLDLAQLRSLVAQVYDVLWEEGPDAAWSPDHTEAVANVLAEAGLGPPLWCVMNTTEAKERITEAFNASDELERITNGNEFDAAVDVFFEHGQWWVRVELDVESGVVDRTTYTFSVADQSGSDSDFCFEEL